MANVKISGLPAATSVTAGTDVAPLVSGGITTKATPQQIVNAGLLAPGAIGSGTPSTGKFTTIESTIATGTAPFTVASTTNVANLNASSLGGATFASPGAIGSGTASTGAFTTLSASSTVSGTGFSTYLASPPAIGTTAPAAGKFTDLTSTGNTTIGDASTDTFTVYPQTISLINSTAITAASTKTLTLNGGAGSNGFILDANNNASFGTTSAYGKLTVSKTNNGGIGGSIWIDNAANGIGDQEELVFSSGGQARNSIKSIAYGASPYNGMLAFLYGSNASSSSLTEALRIDQNGYLLVGYTSSNGAYKLQVNSQIFATSAIIATSDEKYKTNINSIQDGLKIIEKLNPVKFNWKKHEIHNFNTTIPEIGFLAQEVKEALKDTEYFNSLIYENECELLDGTKEKFLGLSEGKIIPILVKAIQELSAELNEIKQKVN